MHKYSRICMIYVLIQIDFLCHMQHCPMGKIRHSSHTKLKLKLKPNWSELGFFLLLLLLPTFRPASSFNGVMCSFACICSEHFSFIQPFLVLALQIAALFIIPFAIISDVCAVKQLGGEETHSNQPHKISWKIYDTARTETKRWKQTN